MKQGYFLSEREHGQMLDALHAFQDALGDLDQWASAGPETFTSDERKRRNDYDRKHRNMLKILTGA